MLPQALSLLLALTVSGCGKTPPPAAQTNIKVQPKKDDPLRVSLDLLRQASEVGHYRAALNQLNAYLSKEAGKQEPFSAEEQAALRKLYRLDDDENAEVQSAL